MLNYDPFKIARAQVELWNNRNPVPYKELLAPAATFRFTFEKEERPALKAIEQYERILHTAAPDIRMEQIDIIPAEGALTIEWMVQGTFAGKVLETEPTGRHAKLVGTTVLKINEDGKIVKETIYVDLTALLTQIGIGQVVPVPAPQRLRELTLHLIEMVNKRDIETLITLFENRPVILWGALPIEALRLNQVLIANLVAMPDLKLQANHIAVRGDEVVVEMVGTAVEPTGKHVKLEGCVILTFVGEKVAKLRLFGDQYAVLTEVGKQPELVLK